MSTSQPLALLYLRVSTADQVEHGASLAAQQADLVREAEARGWAWEVVADEGVSGKTLRRPALQAALARLDAGEAQYLLSVRLDRLSRSVADFAGLLDRADRKRWGIVLLSPGVDTSTPAGRFVANVLASAAEYERGLLSQRTKEGLRQRRAEGVRLGRKGGLSEEVLRRIVDAKAAGQSFRAIAEALDNDEIATAQGGRRWYASTVAAVLRSQDVAALVR